MSFQNLMVHLDDSKACSYRIEAAISLAKRQNAQLTGIAIALKSTISNYIGFEIPSSFGEAQQKLVEEAVGTSVNNFEKMAKEADIKYSSKIIKCDATKAAALLSFHARHTDLCFLGQPNPDEPGSSFRESLLNSILYASGRPVYVVPYVGRPNPKIRNAVIAWDGSKKAVRAVNDAIPLLKGRGEATILIINPNLRKGVHGKKPGKDIAAHLECHGIKTKIICQTFQDANTDTVILNYLSDAGADLLIMGAYNHSRLREKAFGGVTNTVLLQMTTPVLMSE